MPTQWYCPWCAEEAPQTDPWRSPSLPSVGSWQTRKGPTGGPGIQHRVPGESDLRWQERFYGPGRDLDPLSTEEVRELLEQYAVKDSNLSIATIQENEGLYEAVILTPDGNRAGMVQVDRSSGWMRQVE
ncbi:MAG: hypothetical protein ACLFNV_12750 [Desulfovibrionales bacterium]